MTHLVTTKSETPGTLAIPERARKYVAASKSPGTRRVYRAAFKDFKSYCKRIDETPLPASPQVVASYLSWLADKNQKVASINLKAAAIRFAHITAGFESPTTSILVQSTMSGIRRTLGTAQTQKQPLSIKELRAISESLPNTIQSLRDRLILVLGVAASLRRSEIASLDVTSIRRTDDGLVVLLSRSKTDQEGEGTEIGVPFGSHRSTCAVRCLDAYLAATGITSGPLFRPVTKGPNGRLLDSRITDKAIALIVKRAVKRIGLLPETRSGHSLRATLPTASALAGVQERVIAQQTRHKSMTVLRKYIRHGSLFKENAAAMIGL